MRLTFKNGIQGTGRLTRRRQRAIERAETWAGFFQGHREIHAVAHHLADFEGHGFEIAEFLAVFDSLLFICHHVMVFM